MLPSLIYGFILTVIVPKYGRTVSWAGKFYSDEKCDLTGCCCPQEPFEIFKISNKNDFQGFLKVSGDCQAITETTITVNFIDTVNTNAVQNVGSFTMTNSGQLEVSLERPKSRPPCKVIMSHGTIPPGNSNNQGNNVNSGTNTSNGSLASSNHRSILIKFMSIIMIITITVSQ